MDDGKITKDEYKRMARPALLSSIIGVIIGIIPGTELHGILVQL